MLAKWGARRTKKYALYRQSEMSPISIDNTATDGRDENQLAQARAQ